MSAPKKPAFHQQASSLGKRLMLVLFGIMDVGDGRPFDRTEILSGVPGRENVAFTLDDREAAPISVRFGPKIAPASEPTRRPSPPVADGPRKSLAGWRSSGRAARAFPGSWASSSLTAATSSALGPGSRSDAVAAPLSISPPSATWFCVEGVNQAATLRATSASAAGGRARGDGSADRRSQPVWLGRLNRRGDQLWPTPPSPFGRRGAAPAGGWGGGLRTVGPG